MQHMQQSGAVVPAVSRVDAIGIRRQMIYEEIDVAAFSRAVNAAFARNAGNGGSLWSD
jgi:hypothetical protein